MFGSQATFWRAQESGESGKESWKIYAPREGGPRARYESRPPRLCSSFQPFSGPKQSHSLVNPVHCLSKLSWSANASLCGFGKNHTTPIDFQSTPSAHWTKRVGCLGQNRASLFSLLRSLFPSLISSSLIFVSGKFSSPL